MIAYICDNCGKRVEKNELSHVAININDVIFERDFCVRCVSKITGEVDETDHTSWETWSNGIKEKMKTYGFKQAEVAMRALTSSPEVSRILKYRPGSFPTNLSKKIDSAIFSLISERTD